MYSTQRATSVLATQDEAANHYLQKQDDHDGREIKLTHRRKDSPSAPHEGFCCTKEPLIDGEHNAARTQWEPGQHDTEKHNENIEVQKLTQKLTHKLFEL
jgi:hypothetical protein